MDTFRTPLDIPAASKQASYHSKIVFIGSCFTEHIGNWMQDLRLQVMVNPHGILYNPSSIASCIDSLVRKRIYKAADLGFHNNRWFSFDHHGRFSALSQDDCLTAINNSIALGHRTLKDASHLFITLGSAWVYEVKSTGKIVANCHKIPDSSFTRRMLSAEEIRNCLEKSITQVKNFNPELNVVFSLSPVRHTREGITGNALSKASLLVAIHALEASGFEAHYFPAWEIMMDDLRDYRFYEADMLHPNTTAIAYIRRKFADSWLTSETRDIMQEMEKIVKARQHLPVEKETEEFDKFVLSQLYQLEKLKSRHAFLDLSEDLRYFNSLRA